MKRFIKVIEDEQWLDTQADPNKNYFIEVKEDSDNQVYYSDDKGEVFLVGTLEAESDKMVVRFEVYTQYVDVFGEDEEIEWEETNEDEYDTAEEAMKHADQEDYGWGGTFVEVYVNDIHYRNYEVE